MSKVKAGDRIKCVTSIMQGCFTVGCEYAAEKVLSGGFVTVYNDNGDPTILDYPYDPDYGKFEKVD